MPYTCVFYGAWNSRCCQIAFVMDWGQMGCVDFKRLLSPLGSPVVEKPKLSITAALGWNPESTTFIC